MAWIVSGGAAIKHTRLLDCDRTDAGHHLALGLVAAADDAGAAILDLEIGVLVEEAGDLGLDRLRQQGTRTIAQD